jgi:hypothetical protein
MKKTFFSAALVLMGLLTINTARAETSSASTGTESEVRAKTPLNKTFVDTSGITDPKIRADSGSMSLYSMKFNLSYYGPPAGDLSNRNQPNPDGSIGNHETAIGGSIGIRYRLDPETTLSFGTGVNAVTPFQELKRFDVRTPYLSYDKTYRIGAWQIRQSPGVSLVTIPNFRVVGEFASLSYDASVFRTLGLSRFLVGLDSSFGYFLYGRGYRKEDTTAARYNWGLFPTLKYRATDKFGLVTSLALNYWNPRKEASQLVVQNRILSQRVGFEYAFTRDIYFAPYLNFYPQSIAMNSTTLNFSTTFSIL